MVPRLDNLEWIELGPGKSPDSIWQICFNPFVDAAALFSYM